MPPVQVLLLGAGASRIAGYPRAGELLPVIAEYVARSRNTTLRSEWAAWRSYRDSTDGALKDLLHDPNPEVVFSTLDLMQEVRSVEPGDERFLARRGLLYAVHEFFLDRHADDAQDRPRRQWLRERLAELYPGDVVITLNWDTTVERTLGEMGLWNPTTGYGFEKPLALVEGIRLPNFEQRPDPSQLQLLPSDIHVLKLHGSCGWHRRIGGQFYFDHDQLLDRFAFVYEGKPFQFADPDHPDYDLDVPILLYPSFLKQLDDPHLLDIWRAAHAAVRSAELIDVYGYSLPKADGAIRALLASLRERIEVRAVRVAVHENMRDAKERWHALLGPSLRLTEFEAALQISR